MLKVEYLLLFTEASTDGGVKEGLYVYGPAGLFLSSGVKLVWCSFRKLPAQESRNASKDLYKLST